nr:hypothetical protein [Tanacetum cinerariifolium]
SNGACLLPGKVEKGRANAMEVVEWAGMEERDNLYLKLVYHFDGTIAESLPDLTPNGFCRILLDQEGTPIQANTSVKDIDYFNAKLEVGLAYRISNFICEPTKAYQQTLDNKTSLRVGKYTSFDSISATTFPCHYFHFTSYNQLETKIPKPDKNNKMQYPVLTDYIGCIRSVGDVIPFGDANTTHSKRRKIEIENLNGKIIKLTIWDEMAEHFGQAEFQKMQQPVIIAMSSCRVSKYRGSEHIMFKSRYEQTPPLIIFKLPYPNIEKEALRNRYPLKTTMEQNLVSYMAIRFTAEATITSINTNKDWYYVSYHECNKAAINQGEYYRCIDHGPQPGPFFRSETPQDWLL